MSARVWIVIGTAAVVLTAAGAMVWYWMGQGMYRPGDARLALAGSPAASTPASAAGTAGFWEVAPGISLRHFEVGTGTDVLVVHGGPGIPPLRPWTAADSTHGVRWIYYQQRGCGESTRPFDRAPAGGLYRQMQTVEGSLGMASQVADIERIRRLLGRDRLVLLGHSFGALIAALYAAEFPEHVQALVLVSPADLVVMPGRGPDLYESVGARLPAGMREEYAAYHERIFDFRTLFQQDERTLSKTFGEFGRYYAAAGMGVPSSQMAVREDGVIGGWETLALYLSLGRRHDWSDALRTVKAPVLVLHGARDAQPESGSREFAAFFQHAQVEVIPGAGHFSFDEQPRAFADVVERFVSKGS